MIFLGGLFVELFVGEVVGLGVGDTVGWAVVGTAVGE